MGARARRQVGHIRGRWGATCLKKIVLLLKLLDRTGHAKPIQFWGAKFRNRLLWIRRTRTDVLWGYLCAGHEPHRLHPIEGPEMEPAGRAGHLSDILKGRCAAPPVRLATVGWRTLPPHASAGAHSPGVACDRRPSPVMPQSQQMYIECAQSFSQTHPHSWTGIGAAARPGCCFATPRPPQRPVLNLKPALPHITNVA